MGHGTGAACANLLLVSPLSQADGGELQTLSQLNSIFRNIFYLTFNIF